MECEPGTLQINTNIFAFNGLSLTEINDCHKKWHSSVQLFSFFFIKITLLKICYISIKKKFKNFGHRKKIYDFSLGEIFIWNKYFSTEIILFSRFLISFLVKSLPSSLPIWTILPRQQSKLEPTIWLYTRLFI